MSDRERLEKAGCKCLVWQESNPLDLPSWRVPGWPRLMATKEALLFVDAIAAARRDALEEAAKYCDERQDRLERESKMLKASVQETMYERILEATHIAAAIRGLAGEGE